MERTIDLLQCPMDVDVDAAFNAVVASCGHEIVRHAASAFDAMMASAMASSDTMRDGDDAASSVSDSDSDSDSPDEGDFFRVSDPLGRAELDAKARVAESERKRKRRADLKNASIKAQELKQIGAVAILVGDAISSAFTARRVKADDREEKVVSETEKRSRAWSDFFALAESPRFYGTAAWGEGDADAFCARVARERLDCSSSDDDEEWTVPRPPSLRGLLED